MCSSGVVLPEDLSLYLGRKTIVMLILDAVQKVEGERLDFKGFASSDGTRFQAPMLLTLLTYCYATGVYGSKDIELNIGRDPMTRYLCAHTYPDMDILRSFRRWNRNTLRDCLAAVLKRAWELRFSGEEDEPGKDLQHISDSIARPMGPVDRPNFTRDAEERIARAVRSDSMWLDV